MGVDHAAGAVTCSNVDRVADVTVRPADDERDAFYLAHCWSRWFGTKYEQGDRYSSGRLPLPLCAVAGWTIEDELLPDVHAVVAEHDPPDRDGRVYVGAGLASIMSHADTVEELPDGRFDADALAGDQNVWLWFGVVDEAWRGLGLGLGRQLFEKRLQWARDQDVDMAFSAGSTTAGRAARCSGL